MNRKEGSPRVDIYARITDRIFDANFVVDGFFDAILGGIIVSIVSMILDKFLLDDNGK